ncbi:hypothetical protein GCM10010315_30490 [Streptomyces luteosporeus]|uniref:DUF4352 domain-containing protein n=2 Tax=Streptomyces TaxID=1883 RepID=A0ABN3TT49_9ACTN
MITALSQNVPEGLPAADRGPTRSKNVHVNPKINHGGSTMRRKLGTALIVGTLAFAATACNDNADPTAPATAPSGAASSAAPGKETPGKETPGGGVVAPAPKGTPASGATVTVRNKAGVEIAVTLKNWVDPAQSNNKFMKPAAGKHWVAAQLEIINKGKAVYDDSPANGVKVLDAQGQGFTHSIGETTSGPNMPATVKLAPGEKALGYVVVSVPDGTKPQSVQFTPDSGFAKETAKWVLTK